MQYNPAAPCIASTTRLPVQRTSFVRNLPGGALDVDRWLARERKKRGGVWDPRAKVRSRKG